MRATVAVDTPIHTFCAHTHRHLYPHPLITPPVHRCASYASAIKRQAAALQAAEEELAAKEHALTLERAARQASEAAQKAADEAAAAARHAAGAAASELASASASLSTERAAANGLADEAALREREQATLFTVVSELLARVLYLGQLPPEVRPEEHWTRV